jgi:phosphoribosylamine---glycine ligase
MYTILLLGNGGREHAIAASIVKSPKCEKLYVAPGNAGTHKIAFNVILNIADFEQIEQFCAAYHIDWIIVGPEQPLVDGIYDYFLDKPVVVIGPSQAAAALEGSKAFAKTFMEEMSIPTASYRSFTQVDLEAGKQYVANHSMPVVLKADGLAAGKGVLIIDNPSEAVAAFTEMLGGKFGAASSTVVVEQFLTGIEFSVFAATDGKDFVILPEAKDYKRIGEGDTGLNTGGMGAVSPVPFYTPELQQKVLDRVIKPTIAGLQKFGLDYTGFVFFGLINVGGEPYVIEYNCRMGDPETEVVFPRIASDVVELFEAMVNHTLPQYNMQTSDLKAVTVFAVSGGYPGDYPKNIAMDIPEDTEQTTYFHAGTKSKNHVILTNGGRVIACTAMTESIDSARQAATIGVEELAFEGKYYRTDIGKDLLIYLK